MLRDLVAVLVGINAIAAIVGFSWRRIRAGRRLSHDAYVRQLREENEELDKELERLRKDRSN